MKKYTKLLTQYVYVYNCTNNYEVFKAEYPGYYQIECYGAQGGGKQSSGNSDSGIGGKGGYAKGTIKLEKSDILYVYVGCVGKSSSSGIALGGFNGGGAAYASSSGEPANGGGGASDVRLINGSWDNSKGLLSRIIVAGGGGGGGEDSGEIGGYGGGISGGIATTHHNSNPETGGVFGKGAHTKYDGGGGGGGWIGGHTNGGSQTLPTSNDSTDADGGSGGSGYIYTNTSQLYSGYLVPTKYQMTDTSLIGNVNEGDGSVIITPFILVNHKSCKYKDRRRSFVTDSTLLE